MTSARISILIGLAVLMLLTCVIGVGRIPSGSMRPTLQVGDYLVFNRVSYAVRVPFANDVALKTGTPKRGDVVVFHSPMTNEMMVKRIIGLPGDHIAMHGGALQINSQNVEVQNLELPQLDQRIAGYQHKSIEARTEALAPGLKHAILVIPNSPAVDMQGVLGFPGRSYFSRLDENGFDCVVPAGQYLVLGDNRNSSFDSRYWGFLPEGDIIGKASVIWLNYQYATRIGTSVK